jgi:hypothetical protein
MPVTFDAHFDGNAIVPDEPTSLPVNARLRVTVTALVDAPSPRGSSLLDRLPLIRIDPGDAEAINRDPEFDVE